MRRKRITAETMKNLGFTEKWPGGNPTECWWENPPDIDVGDVWITSLLTPKQFWAEFANRFKEEGRREVREIVRKAARDIGL